MTTHVLQAPALWTQQLSPTLIKLCQNIAKKGGKAWLVGGCVRDLCLGIKPKDMDLEIYGLSADNLQKITLPMGHSEQVGKHFGVLKLWVKGEAFDLALPRTEKKTHAGHAGFDITHDIHLSPRIASLRRDFTINAMMFDPLTSERLDFHGGQKDLQCGRLRHVSPAFSEDPLRVLRAMQFAARFRLKLTPETAQLCHDLLPEASTLACSRIWGEWQKWAHAAYPSFGLQALHDSGWLGLYPSLTPLLNCPQDSRWHPEGNAWKHTLQVCDQASFIAKRENLNDKSTEYLVFAALCHDLGKPETTFTDEAGHVHSPNHSQAGIEPSRAFLQNIAAPKWVERYVTPLVYDHITHLSGQPSARAIRRLAHRLEPASIELWERLVEADASGRAPSPPSRPALPWLEKARKLESHRQKIKPIITGKFLIIRGISSGKKMGAIIQQAYEAQLDGSFDDEDSADHWLLQTSRNHDV
ncbi:MAG: HD domain-containing protein [Mariprofundaceae bacterium]|nr:HD domain-containing protein [Mariprofundaceae bacterium]